MNAPITYYPKFLTDPDVMLSKLQQELDWQRRGDTPRMEYYVNEFGVSYIYGRGRGQREYLAQPTHEVITEIQQQIEELTHTKFEVCFLNRYLNQSDHLGWHADDSPEMDDSRPIAIVSLGVERDIMFRKFLGTICVECQEYSPNHKTPDCPGPGAIKDKVTLWSGIERLRLEHGSLCLMAPGMQDNWQHRIPKASFHCGERVSLTYRGYVKE